MGGIATAVSKSLMKLTSAKKEPEDVVPSPYLGDAATEQHIDRSVIEDLKLRASRLPIMAKQVELLTEHLGDPEKIYRDASLIHPNDITPALSIQLIRTMYELDEFCAMWNQLSKDTPQNISTSVSCIWIFCWLAQAMKNRGLDDLMYTTADNIQHTFSHKPEDARYVLDDFIADLYVASRDKGKPPKNILSDGEVLKIREALLVYAYESFSGSKKPTFNRHISKYIQGLGLNEQKLAAAERALKPLYDELAELLQKFIHCSYNERVALKISRMRIGRRPTPGPDVLDDEPLEKEIRAPQWLCDEWITRPCTKKASLMELIERFAMADMIRVQFNTMPEDWPDYAEQDSEVILKFHIKITEVVTHIISAQLLEMRSKIDDSGGECSQYLGPLQSMMEKSYALAVEQANRLRKSAGINADISTAKTGKKTHEAIAYNLHKSGRALVEHMDGSYEAICKSCPKVALEIVGNSLCLLMENLVQYNAAYDAAGEREVVYVSCLSDDNESDPPESAAGSASKQSCAPRNSSSVPRAASQNTGSNRCSQPEGAKLSSSRALSEKPQSSLISKSSALLHTVSNTASANQCSQPEEEIKHSKAWTVLCIITAILKWILLIPVYCFNWCKKNACFQQPYIEQNMDDVDVSEEQQPEGDIAKDKEGPSHIVSNWALDKTNEQRSSRVSQKSVATY